jgi:hypothetical protein
VADRTIDIRPSNSGYMNMLRVIIQSTTSTADREWARIELAKWERAVDAAVLQVPAAEPNDHYLIEPGSDPRAPLAFPEARGQQCSECGLEGDLHPVGARWAHPACLVDTCECPGNDMDGEQRCSHGAQCDRPATRLYEGTFTSCDRCAAGNNQPYVVLS